MNNPDPLRAVCIGAGGFNRANHAPVLKRLAEGDEPRLSLEAVCDLDRERAERFQQEFGFRRVHTNLARMMDEVRPEVVYSLVQPTATAGVVSQVLPTGLPVFTEKPPGVSVEEANRLAELAETHGNLTYVAFNRRQMPVMRGLKQWLTDNAPARYVRGEMLRNRRREPEFGIGTAIHALDALRFLCGDVEDVDVRAQLYDDGACADYFAKLRFVDGLTAELQVIVDCGMLRESYHAFAERAGATAVLGAGYSSPWFQPGFTVHANAAEPTFTPVPGDHHEAGGFLGEHVAFLDAVESGERPDCCLQDAAESVALATEVHAAFRKLGGRSY
jgi:predicted dehydrogenase